MTLNHRENYLRNASLEGHEWIPINVVFSQAYWREAREDLENCILRHPTMFPDFEKGKTNFDAGIREPGNRHVVDAWGCEWDYELDGLDGIVVGHPLEDWDALETWSPPDPGAPPEFNDETRRQWDERRARGEVIGCGTDHGFFFMRLYYLRGYENFMMDVATGDPRLDALVEKVAGYWEQRLRPWVDEGVDQLGAADDLGTQTASMLGPAHFRRWVLPTYRRLFQPARERGAHVAMHHDGYIMDIMDLIIESGVSIVNPQDLVNGIDNLVKDVKGRVCINLDIDRQEIVPFGNPNDVRELIREEIMKLGSPAGGLQMVCGIYPPTPIENIDAMLTTMEEYRTYWVGR